jgi:ribosomal protein S18 acetylase RimI-like enzyme
MPKIARLGVDALEPLRELLRICWTDTYTGILPDAVIRTAIETWQSKDAISSGLSTPNAYYAGYFDDGDLRGMVAARMVDESTLRIVQLYVHPEHQRKGIGRKLMDAAVTHFDKAVTIVLEVEEDNPKGVAFYRRYGFDYPRKAIVNVGMYEIPCLVGVLRLNRP